MLIEVSYVGNIANYLEEDCYESIVKEARRNQEIPQKLNTKVLNKKY